MLLKKLNYSFKHNPYFITITSVFMAFPSPLIPPIIILTTIITAVIASLQIPSPYSKFERQRC